MNKKHHTLYPLPPQTRVLRGLITHSGVNTKIEQSVNVHEIQHYVHEMFTMYPSETHFHEAYDKLTIS